MCLSGNTIRKVSLKTEERERGRKDGGCAEWGQAHLWGATSHEIATFCGKIRFFNRRESVWKSLRSGDTQSCQERRIFENGRTTREFCTLELELQEWGCKKEKNYELSPKMQVNESLNHFLYFSAILIHLKLCVWYVFIHTQLVSKYVVCYLLSYPNNRWNFNGILKCSN